jgi:hypothetical protein
MTRRTCCTTDRDVVAVADANDQIQAGIGERGQVVVHVDPRTDRRRWQLQACSFHVARPSSGCRASRKELSS